MSPTPKSSPVADTLPLSLPAPPPFAPPNPTGTEEHHMRTGVEAGHGMGVMGTGVGTGYGHNTGMGTGTAYDTHHTGVGTGIGGVGTHHTGMAGTGVGTGGIDPETGKETMGHKIKKMIPGGYMCMRMRMCMPMLGL